MESPDRKSRATGLPGWVKAALWVVVSIALITAIAYAWWWFTTGSATLYVN